jgi:hypothetical protein
MRTRLAFARHDLKRHAFFAGLRVARRLPHWLRKAVVIDAAADASYEHSSTPMDKLSPADLLKAA